MPGSPTHLVRRFFDVLFAKPLAPAEAEAVRGWVTPELAEVFFAQGHADQRHGLEAARFVEAGGGDRDVVVAALLHDVGKRHARLGVIGRSVASLLILARLPLTSRMRAYRDHGLSGAAELVRLGAPPVAIDFAMHHHGRRPPTIEPALWDLLVAADEPPKTAGRSGGRITSPGT